MHAKVFVAADGLEAIGGNTQFSTVEFNGDKQQFDGVVSADSVQTIYDTVLQPLINNLFKGYNVSLLLFGRSDAKKSELVHGGRRLSDRRALLRLAMDSIYDRLEALKMGNNEIPLMSVQMVQLCGELVRDLIDLSKDNITYEENIIKEPYIPDLTKIQIDSLPRGHDVLDKIARNREAIHSSFHPFCTEIFTLEIHHENSPHTPDFWDDQTQSRRSWGKLTVVDLCGSELFEENINKLILREGPYLAKSISAVKTVIEYFSSTKKTSPFDFSQSIATRYLWEEFGGNRICHHLISTTNHKKSNDFLIEFGQSIRKIETCPVRRGANLDDLLTRLARRYSSKGLDTQLKSNISGKAETGAALSQTLQQVQLKNTELQETIQIFQAKANELSQRNAMLERKLEMVEKEKVGKEKECGDAKMALEEGRGEWTRIVDEYERKIAMNVEEMKEKDENVGRLEEELRKGDERNKELLGINRQREAQNEELSKSNQDLIKWLEDVNEKYRKEKSKCSDIALELAFVLNNKSSLSKAQDNASIEMLRLKHHNDYLAKRLEKSRKVHFFKGEKVNQLLEQEENLRRKTEEEKLLLEQRINMHENEIMHLSKDLESQKKVMDDQTKKSRTKLREEVDRLEEKCARLEMELLVSKKENQSFQKLAHDRDMELRKRDEEMDVVRKELMGARDKQETMASEFRSKLELFSKEAVTVSSTFVVDKEAALDELRAIVNRTFKELFDSFSRTEENLRAEVERMRKDADAARQALKHKSSSSGGGGGGGGSTPLLSKEQIRQHIQLYIQEIQQEMERERSVLLSRALVAEKQLELLLLNKINK